MVKAPQIPCPINRKSRFDEWLVSQLMQITLSFVLRIENIKMNLGGQKQASGRFLATQGVCFLFDRIPS